MSKGCAESPAECDLGALPGGNLEEQIFAKWRISTGSLS